MSRFAVSDIDPESWEEGFGSAERRLVYLAVAARSFLKAARTMAAGDAAGAGRAIEAARNRLIAFGWLSPEVNDLYSLIEQCLPLIADGRIALPTEPLPVRQSDPHLGDYYGARFIELAGLPGLARFFQVHYDEIESLRCPEEQLSLAQEAIRTVTPEMVAAGVAALPGRVLCELWMQTPDELVTEVYRAMALARPLRIHPSEPPSSTGASSHPGTSGTRAEDPDRTVS